MDLKYFKGNLFSAPSNVSLAHCVSRDMKMGAGIAAQFKNTFGNVDLLLSQEKKVGEVAYMTFPDRNVFNLITKELYFHKPTYDNLRIALTNLRLLCEQLDVTKLAMPKIGCGLDKLQWIMVENIIKSVFLHSKIEISIYYL